MKPFHLKRADKIIICILIAATVLAAVFAGLSGKKGETTAEPSHQITHEDYIGKKIGVMTGTNMEQAALEFFPGSEYQYYDGYPDMNAALEAGIIDAYLGDEPALKSIHAAQPSIDYIKERLTQNSYSFAFRKNDPGSKKICDQLNEFLKEIRSDGTYAQIDSVWFGADESLKVVDMSGLTGENGTIRVVTTSTDEPFSYIKDGANVGFDIDVAVRFARAYGYNIEIGDVSFQARIPALDSGQYDFTTSMNVTPEREEAVLFSDPVSEGGIVTAVRSEDLQGQGVSVSDFNGKRAGITTGSIHDSIIHKVLPDSPISEYSNYTDLTTALKTGLIDYFLASTDTASHIIEAEPDLAVLDEPVMALDIGAMFGKTQKGQQLKAQMDAFIVKIQKDGTLDEIFDYWSRPESASKPVDLSVLTGENGTLRFATSGTKVPVSFVADGQIAGSDPDIAVRFCREYGYGIEVFTVNTAGIIPGLATGVYDFSLSEMVITEERKESVLFSEPYRAGNMFLIARKSDLGIVEDGGQTESKGFFQGLVDSFNKNFIRESRWKLILQGIQTTCFITFFAGLFGTILAFLVCMFRRMDSTLANPMSNIYVKIMQGTPMVVVLMILYYVVLGKAGLPAVWVAVVGFSLNVGAYGSEIMRSGIESVDRGQREAAIALGFTERQAFFDFIFPQAAVTFLPVYRGELVSLLKGTSIVGYISILDLTKMSDIIRSRTYEAFFPLLATALIYFVLAWVISVLMSALLARVDWKTREKTDPKEG